MVQVPAAPANNIYQALLAVGAAGSHLENDFWVDTNGDGVEQDSEVFANSQCATGFSNYGSWVQIVAPGEDVWSTTPSVTISEIILGFVRLAMTPGAAPRWPRHCRRWRGARLERKPGRLHICPDQETFC